MNYSLPLAQFSENVANHPNKAFLHQPVQRQWRTWSWQQVDDQARRIANGLKNKGLIKGDRVAILAKNSAEWFITDLAIMMAGLISVPVYATAGEDTIEYILKHSEAKLIFVGKLDSPDATKAALSKLNIPSVRFNYESSPQLNGSEEWDDWISKQQPLDTLHIPSGEDTLSIVYTSGSTGTPKGAVITHHNFAAASYETAQIMPAGNNRIMSYLPLAHITERSVVEYMSFYNVPEVFFVESLDTFLDDVKYAEPTIFLSVPRLWTKFQSGILAKMPDVKLQKLLRIPIIGGLIAKKIRSGLGLNRCKMFASGSAPIPAEILHWYRRIGINICEGWGMTETSGLSCANTPFNADRIGTIGLPQACVEMMLSDQSEILIRGDAVFKEYYLNPETTAAAFTGDWFHTGDRAEITNDGAWKIVGRLNEQFKTSKGKFVTPVPIESMLVANSYLEQACVLGAGRKQPIAAVVMAECCPLNKQELHTELQALIEQVNATLESHQQLDHLIVSQDFWTVENGKLTPTLKIKRNKIAVEYDAFLHESLPDTIVWQAEL